MLRSGNNGVTKDFFASTPTTRKSLFLAALAQQVEHLTCNEDVLGSIPGGGSNKLFSN